MNSGTLVGSLIFAAVLVVVIAVVIQLMMRAWQRRAQQQAELIGMLPEVPGEVGAAIITTRGALLRFRDGAGLERADRGRRSGLP